MNRSVQWKLWLMMFLEYSVWGAWFVFLGEHLGDIGVSGTHVGLIYSTLGWGALISPSIAGMIVDRWFATERYLALSHLLGGGLLLTAAALTNWFHIYLVLLIYAIIYMPTLALTNSISFHHMENPDREFGKIRVGGTMGWIVANLLLTGWLWLRLKDPNT